jgi:PKD repeat protein
MDRLAVEGNKGGGVLADHVALSHLRNCTVIGNRNGLEMTRSHGWRVEDNVIKQNRWNGIELNHSGSARDNVFRNNLITANSQSSGSSFAGIFFYGRDSSDNLVVGNTISHNPYGLHFLSTSGMCWHNTMRLNKIKNCVYGVWESTGTGPNSYHLNVFAGNNVHVGDLNSASTFDDGELGNYWSDYEHKYPQATREGPVWSEPYVVSKRSMAVDMRPLAFKYEQDPPVITNLRPVSSGPMVPGVTATFEVWYTEGSAIDSYVWKMTPPNGKEEVYTTRSYWFTYAFERPGLHTLSVEVVDVWGLSAERSAQYNVEDTTPPVAVAGDDVVVALGTFVVLDGSGSSDNHEIASISWLFDPDGQASMFATSIVTLRMTELGTFKAVLTVADPSGNSASDSLYIQVKDMSPPVAQANTEDTMLSLGETATFNGSASKDNVGIVYWQWTVLYGNMRIRNVREMGITHTFEKMGQYDFELTVKDAAGHADSLRFTVTVRDTVPPVAEAGADQRVVMGTQVFFRSIGSTDNVGITKYEWSFSYQRQMHTVRGSFASYQFEEPGEYRVTLVVYDAAGNHASDNMRVTVVDTVPPEASFWSPDEARMGETITLDASGSGDNLGVRRYEWTVVHHGTIEVLDGVMAEYTFGRPGPYTFTLTVTDAAGNEDTMERTYDIPSEEVEAEVPAWLVPSMVAVLAAAVLLGYIYARRRYREEEE